MIDCSSSIVEIYLSGCYLTGIPARVVPGCVVPLVQQLQHGKEMADCSAQNEEMPDGMVIG